MSIILTFKISTSNKVSLALFFKKVNPYFNFGILKIKCIITICIDIIQTNRM
ncbi:MAG: hypothetical protein HFJ47_04675 [Clostridia bacterium]|nr:hypothetical protein [Clostridia bacterium]